MFFSTLMVVDASTISKIDMDIYVDNNGIATITETWDADVTEGTEGWHPYYNLGVSEIYDVKVKMDGVEFSTVSSWNENSSLSDKAYKAGLYYPESNEVDIVFGISSYGTHEYQIQYKIINFVSTIEDADMIYWNLFPKSFSASPDSVTIRIYSDFKYSNTLAVWGYGQYGAPCYVYDGRIEMSSEGSLNSDEYLTILVKFDKGTFHTDSVLSENFDYYYKMAEKGAVNYSDKTSFWRKLRNILIILFQAIVYFIPWVIIVIVSIKANQKNQNVQFGSAGNKIRKDVPNFREIPCDNDIFRAYWVATNYKLTRKKEDFLGSIILKWLRDGNVRIETITKTGVFNTKEESNIIFEKRPDAISLEGKLYDYMNEASGDGKLESGEFKKWCSKNYSIILKWFDDVLNFENKMLVNHGKAQVVTVGKIFKHDVYQIDDAMMQEAEQMAGLKKFLKEFSRIQEREPIEVKLWNEYLMYAQIFGMADEVAKQFKKLYPEVIQNMEEMGYNYNTIYFVHTITNDGIQSANNARARAQAYSSGGGGFSSSGGGGGSFGGGGGGGGFR